ncbi:MAG: hypothetical protein NZM25_07095 [Leptospiraceae bacterium]|nr:hypothetical protein [Leptospiraceae bacterium]
MQILKLGLSCLALFYLVYCRTTPEDIPEEACVVSADPGWLDDHSYQLRSLGQTGQKGGTVKRRTLSQENALLCAQASASELILENKKRIIIHPEEAKKRRISEKFLYYLKGGQIVRQRCDENDACEILFKIQAENLKKKLQEEQS